ncbi:hypothetical protein, partial [Psychroserpens mesophilus]|uniref:hypothetical protein n=1 Tax=Psychroserpens mesophilus TaxID=325473 RepID=UPI003D6469B4
AQGEFENERPAFRLPDIDGLDSCLCGSVAGLFPVSVPIGIFTGTPVIAGTSTGPAVIPGIFPGPAVAGIPTRRVCCLNGEQGRMGKIPV